MDISLITTDRGTHLRPMSIHGILWLQTHFAENHWEALASGLVKLPNEEARELCEDANQAGLNLGVIPELSISTKFQ